MSIDNSEWGRISASADFLRERGFSPEYTLVLGSGLSQFSDDFSEINSIAYSEIPGFVPPGVGGHKGRLIYAEISGARVGILSGRVHFYEGNSPDDCVFPLRVMRALGAHTAILTCAAGGLTMDTGYMLVEDFMNFSGNNPLLGKNIDELGVRFPDMSEVFDLGLRKAAAASAKRHGIPLPAGVYVQVTGPMYETPSEIRFFAKAGGDAIGMSLAYEAIACRHAGFRTLGLCAITNKAAGLGKTADGNIEILEHTDVVNKSRSLFDGIIAIVKDVISGN